jgi:hypothetical protein
MTHATFAATPRPGTPGAGRPATGYQPGVCNIGSAEIARRRRAGDVGAIVTVVVLVVLIVVHAPPLVRLVVALPAAGAASGYLQAWFRFCAGFGSRGIFNFGQLGQTSSVADPEARALDRAKATQIGLASLVVGGAAAAVAVVLSLAGSDRHMDPNILLWVGQVLLALSFLAVAYGHSLRFEPSSARPDMGWLLAVGQRRMRIIGALEGLGAIGLIVPAATGILPWLTPVAASCLTVLMVFAAIFHARRVGETRNTITNLVLAVIAFLVAYGRFSVSPL